MSIFTARSVTTQPVSPVYGVIAGPLVAALVAAGHIVLNVHGMLTVVVAETLWFAAAGIWLFRTEAVR